MVLAGSVLAAASSSTVAANQWSFAVWHCRIRMPEKELAELRFACAVAAGPMVLSPTGGGSWRFRLAATFLFPKK
jgi:hypothetical protein